MNFNEFLRNERKSNGDPLSPTTIEHYDTAIKTISKDMLSAGIINKPLDQMEICELDLAVHLILKNNDFIKKNDIGKKMYSNALKRYRCYKYLETDLGTQAMLEEALVRNDKNLTADEKEEIIKSRRGQGIYQANLLNKYNRECVITKISASQVLIASHIKPWSVCNNNERLDVNNGLILSATYERLFDSGLITFDSTGALKVSKLITTEDALKLNIKNGAIYDIKFTPEMETYLKYHNDVIYID